MIVQRDPNFIFEDYTQTLDLHDSDNWYDVSESDESDYQVDITDSRHD